IEPAELAELQSLSSRIAACVSHDAEDDASLHAHAELTNEFHLAIARASGNPRLFRMIVDFRDYFLSADFLKLYDRPTMRRFQSQHEAILDALRTRDSQAAERLVREHFADAFEIIGCRPEFHAARQENP
ncbi:MAG: FCD domain-containing protein, partial [Vulcanimicrobiaceae bacterium]